MCSSLVHAAPRPEGALGLGLRELLVFQRAHPNVAGPQWREALDAGFDGAASVVLDAQGRVRVDVTLDGSRTLETVSSALAALDARLVAQVAWYRHGLLTAYLPVAQVERLLQLPGIRAARLALKPVPSRRLSQREIARAAAEAGPVSESGRVVSQGAAVMRSDVANRMGFDGRGITIGVLAGSYNRQVGALTRAPLDVKAGELPGLQNPDGHTEPVVVKDYPAALGASGDQGRAILQIIHDVAPAARLCFVSVWESQAQIAEAYGLITDKAGPCGADVVVDDQLWYEEPMFSDGVISQAIDRAAAAGVAVFATAGNANAAQTYVGTFNQVSSKSVRAVPQSVNLALIDPILTKGGFHNYSTNGSVDIAQTVTLTSGDNEFTLQWNDPFDAGAVTTDYDVYIFSADGQSIVARSTYTNAPIDMPLERLTIAAPGTYQIVIALKSPLNGEPVAKQIRYANGAYFDSVASGEYLAFNTPTSYGHQVAKGTIGTGSAAWWQTYVPRYFTGLGPGTIWLDADGTRLATPEIRQKPDITAPDGVNTTFYGGDNSEDADTVPNFYSTAASIGHAAGVAALLLQKAGGPGSLTAEQVRTLLQKGAKPRNLTPTRMAASATVGPVTVSLRGIGDDSQVSTNNPDAFKLTLTGPAGYTLQSAVLDLDGANPQRVRLGVPAPGLVWDPRTFPFTLGTVVGLAPTDISIVPLAAAAPFSKRLEMSFTPGSFGTGRSVSFGIDRDEVAADDGGGNWMGYLAGGSLSGSLRDPSGATLEFSVPMTSGKVGRGYSPNDGYGLVDAVNSLKLIP